MLAASSYLILLGPVQKSSLHVPSLIQIIKHMVSPTPKSIKFDGFS